jgi:hypothetical protein
VSLRGAFIWGVNYIQGVSPTTPLLPTTITPGSNIVGFSVPVIAGGFGTTDPVYIDPVIATGYDFAVTGTKFRSVLIPAPLPHGDASFELQFDGHSVPLLAGTAYDFSALEPGGVTAFSIRGIDPSEMLDPTNPLAFVTGLIFTDAGIANVTMTPVPEPSSTVLCGAAAAVAAFATRRRERKQAPPVRRMVS